MSHNIWRIFFSFSQGCLGNIIPFCYATKYQKGGKHAYPNTLESMLVERGGVIPIRVKYQNSDVITVAVISVPRRSTHGPGINSGNAFNNTFSDCHDPTAGSISTVRKEVLPAPYRLQPREKGS